MERYRLCGIFFETYANYLEDPIWRNAGLDPAKPRLSAERVAQEAVLLAGHIKKIAKNVEKGILPDFDMFFEPLQGQYSYINEFVPHKAYGPFFPSLLRIYALRFRQNEYLIVYGGIKLGSTIQNSPILNTQVFKHINSTMAFLKSNGIFDKEDI